MIIPGTSSTKKMSTKRIPSRIIMQAFIIFIFAAAFSMADTLMARNREITANENRPNYHLSYETRAAIEELSEILKHLFPVVPGIRRSQIIHNNNNFREQNHHYIGVGGVGNNGRYKHHDGLWIEPSVLPPSIQNSAHRSKVANRISLRKDSMDKNRPFLLAPEHGSDEDIVNGLNDNKDTARNENVMEAVIQRQSLRSRQSPQQHRKSKDPIEIEVLLDRKPIMENMDHDDNLSNHPFSPALFFMNKQKNSINSNSNRINFTPKPIQDGVDNNDVDDDHNGDGEMLSSVTPPTTTSSTTTTTSSSISNPFLTQDSIHQIHNRLSELIQKHQQRRLEQQRLNGFANNKSNYRQRPVSEMEQSQSQQSSPSASRTHFSSPTLGKRGPECMRRCIMQGLLHPVQCHSLC